MDTSKVLIDKKIKNILKDLREAHTHSEKFYAREVVPGKPTVPLDIYDMALAFENEQRIYIDLQLARSALYPNFYTAEQIDHLTKERERLSKRIRSWQNRQFPSQYKNKAIS